MTALVSALALALPLALLSAQPSPPAGPPGDVYVHTLVKGDTLIGLGQRLLTTPGDWRTVQRVNRIRNPRRLRPGAPLRIPVDLLRHLPGSAEVEWVSGRVLVQRTGVPEAVALMGAVLEPGTTIVTEREAAVRLRLSGGAVLTVGEQSRMTLIDLREYPTASASRTIIGVERGRVQQQVTPRTAPGQRYEIRTPVVTTAVRGTDFRVGVDETGATAATEVTDGVVDVSGTAAAAAPVAVAEGFGTLARLGEPLPAPRALLPPPSFEGVTSVLNRLPVRTRWAPVPGAVRYRVEVWPVADDRVVGMQVVSGPEAFWPDLPDGDYRLMVRGIEADGLEGRDTIHPLTVDARPEPPLARAPALDATLFGDDVAFEWTRPSGVPAFDLQVAADASFASPVLERTNLDGLALAASLPPAAYVWRIASRVAGERGPWSDPMSFELKPMPPAGPPAGVGGIDKSSLVLRWAAGIDGDRYRVQMARDDAFADIVVDDTIAEPSLSVPRPAAGVYFIRVGIVNADGTPGPFGVTQSLDVPKPPRSKWWWLLAPVGAVGALIAVL